MKALIAPSLLAALLAAGARDAQACSCMPQGPPCEAYWTAAAIFRGRAELLGPIEPPDEAGQKSRTIRFTVLESFKGVSAASVDVKTPVGGASCGYRFARGREYLVYAAVDAGGALVTSVCMRTRPVGRAPADLEYARDIARGGSPLGRVGGRVLLFTYDLLTRRRRTRPMGNTAVRIRRGEFSVDARTNRAGEFAVAGLEPGSYSVSLDLEGSYTVDVFPDPVVIRDARACAATEAGVYPDGRVSGRILHSTNRPVRGLTVVLTVPGTPPRELTRDGPDRLRAVTRDDGTYELIDVPPGRFVVGIGAGQSLFDLAAYHPGVVSRSDAVTLVVPTGGRVSLGDFVVPASVRLLEISGVVFDSEQTPVEGARVYLRGPAERDFILTEPVETDLSGRFTIAAIEQAYTLFAERYRPGIPHGRLDSSELLRIAPSPAPASIRLTLRPRY